MPSKSTSQPESFLELLNDESIDLLSTSGVELVERLGTDAIKAAIFDVLSGRNLRDSTEILTRRRLASLNAAMVSLFLNGTKVQPNFVEELPQTAERILRQDHLSKAEKWVAQWILGLTTKATQNILRDDVTLLKAYRERYVTTCEEVIQESTRAYGELDGELKLGGQSFTTLSWKFMVYLLGAAGAQTLTIRGSEKSTYGRLFERLVLGVLLSIFGFEYTGTNGPKRFEHEFWLSSSQSDNRESDATALVRVGQGVRFDIGFIGRGNPEISLDKVTRFAREIEMNDSKWYMATIIIVDRIGKGSRIEEMAREVGGNIVQMSMGYWPQEVARILHESIGFEHALINMPHSKIRSYLLEAIKKIELADFLL